MEQHKSKEEKKSEILVEDDTVFIRAKLQRTPAGSTMLGDDNDDDDVASSTSKMMKEMTKFSIDDIPDLPFDMTSLLETPSSSSSSDFDSSFASLSLSSAAGVNGRTNNQLSSSSSAGHSSNSSSSNSRRQSPAALRRSTTSISKLSTSDIKLCDEARKEARALL